jgi:NagD protein
VRFVYTASVKLELRPDQAVLLDLDGTIHHEEHPLPGAIEFIRAVQSNGTRFACLSNSTTSPQRLAERLDRMGVSVSADAIYTAARAACDYVLETFSGRLPRVFNLATEGVHEMLDGRVHWVSTTGEPCDAVICGAPANAYATEDRRRVALQLLRTNLHYGAQLVGICADRVYPSPRGLEFGSGAFSYMIGYASNLRPIFCGKPEKLFFTELCRRMNIEASQCVLIGDNLEADIAGGKAMGMKTILTLTGVTRRRDVPRISEELRPDRIVDDLRELI